MGEGKFSFSIPMQMLWVVPVPLRCVSWWLFLYSDLYIVEESHLLAHYNSINRVSINMSYELSHNTIIT